jgi:hypothetical protein
LILEVGAAGAEEEAVDSCRDRLRGAIVHSWKGVKAWTIVSTYVLIGLGRTGGLLL